MIAEDRAKSSTATPPATPRKCKVTLSEDFETVVNEEELEDTFEEDDPEGSLRYLIGSHDHETNYYEDQKSCHQNKISVRGNYGLNAHTQ